MKRLFSFFLIAGCLLATNCLQSTGKKEIQPLKAIKAFDKEGNLAVLDVKKKVLMFYDKEFTLQWKKKIKGGGPGEVKSPSIMGMGDFIYIYDDKMRKVVTYDKNGKLLQDRRLGRLFVGLQPLSEEKWVVVEQEVNKKEKKIFYTLKITENFEKEEVIETKERPFGFKSISQFWENYIPFDCWDSEKLYFVKGRGYEIYVLDLKSGQRKLFYKEDLPEVELTKEQEKGYKSKLPGMVKMLVSKIKSLPVVEEILSLEKNVVVLTNVLDEKGEKRRVDVFDLEGKKLCSFWSDLSFFRTGEFLISYERGKDSDVFHFFKIKNEKEGE